MNTTNTTDFKPDTTLNADYAEIAKFTNLADEWWDKNGAFKPLHDINPLRLGFIDQMSYRHFGSNLTNKKILDVGCGGGILAYSMMQIGADVLGIDLGEQNIAAAQIHNQKMQTTERLDFCCVAVEALAQQTPQTFDIITCMEMLEHVPDPYSIVKACFNLLKPNGLLVLSTINRNPKSYLFAIVGAEYVLNLLEKGTHDYHKFITPAELDKMCQMAGFKRFDMTGLHYNPLTRHYWLSPKNVDVNYMMAVTKP